MSCGPGVIRRSDADVPRAFVIVATFRKPVHVLPTVILMGLRPKGWLLWLIVRRNKRSGYFAQFPC